MELIDLIVEEKGNTVVSVIGFGGKTSLIRRIAAYLRPSNRVMITSTVDINRIPEGEIDFIDYQYQRDYLLKDGYTNGVYLFSDDITNDNLLKGLTLTEIEKLSSSFDVSLIECDMSYGKSLKAWREFEPLIPQNTTCTLGVIDLSSLGKEVNVKTIYNLDVFMDITGKSGNELIDAKDVFKIITSKDGMFGKSIGKKVLFINKVETENLLNEATTIAMELSLQDIDHIIIGSVRKGEFNIVK